MADETAVVDAQEAEATPAQEATTTPADALEADATPQDLEAARKLRREAAALRKRVEELERDKLSESERLQKDFETTAKERDALRAELRSMKATAALGEAGAIYPSLVAKELPEDSFDDPKALAAAIKGLKAQYPTMFRNANGSADGGAGQGGQNLTTPSIDDLIRDFARTS